MSSPYTKRYYTELVASGNQEATLLNVDTQINIFTLHGRTIQSARRRPRRKKTLTTAETTKST